MNVTSTDHAPNVDLQTCEDFAIMFHRTHYTLSHAHYTLHYII